MEAHEVTLSELHEHNRRLRWALALLGLGFAH